MTQFDATQGAQISKQIAEAVERPAIGRVVEVFEHVTDEDQSNFEVDVELIDTRDKQLRAIPWQAPHTDEIKVPKVGDKVMVEFRGRSKKVPIARNAIYGNQTRPPKGQAGTWRKRVRSGDSPAGDGDLYIESRTEYDQNQGLASFEQDSATEQSAHIRIAKKDDDLDNSLYGDKIPMMFELVDNPADNESHISLEINKVNGFDSFDTWGLKFDVATGEFKILDANGYGIVSDGSGNFTWYYESIDHVKGDSTSL